jgi:hypothetical protein
MAWAASHEAPRDRHVWLFLPGGKWTANADGTASDVVHRVCVARWNAAESAWLESETRQHVYPSLWSDAAVDGAAPDFPELT